MDVVFNTNVSSNTGNGLGVWGIISLIVAIAGGFVVYFIFMKKDGNFQGFLGWLHKYLNFKTLLIEDILKISYLILAAFMTLFSLGLIAVNIASFFMLLIGGNLVLRLTYEMSILLIKICQNTSEINSKLKK